MRTLFSQIEVPPLVINEIRSMETKALQFDGSSQQVVHNVVLELNGISKTKMLDCRDNLEDADKVIRGELGCIVNGNGISTRYEEEVESRR